MKYSECITILKNHKGSMGKRNGMTYEIYLYYVDSSEISELENCKQIQLQKIMKSTNSTIPISERFDIVVNINSINNLILNRPYYLTEDIYANDWIIIYEDNTITGEYNEL